MDEQRQDVQLEPTYNSFVPIQDVALKTYRKRWTIERNGEKGSRISVLMAQPDDNDDDCLFTGPLAKWVEYSLMIREAGVQSEVESY